jgi:hypothetical protein
MENGVAMEPCQCQRFLCGDGVVARWESFGETLRSPLSARERERNFGNGDGWSVDGEDFFSLFFFFDLAVSFQGRRITNFEEEETRDLSSASWFVSPVRVTLFAV